MKPSIDHIQITVKDFAKAEAFYDKLMPILGFDPSKKGKGRVDAHDFDVIEYVHKNVVIGINSPRESLKGDEVHRRRPGSREAAPGGRMVAIRRPCDLSAWRQPSHGGQL